MSLQLHIYEEHTIDLSEAAVISTEGEAAVFAQIEYSYGAFSQIPVGFCR